MDQQDKTLQASAELWNEFMKINSNEMHPDDVNDFRHHLHALQNIIYTQKYKKQTITFEVTGQSLISVLDRKTIDRNDSL